jgi:hypothetical protein
MGPECGRELKKIHMWVNGNLEKQMVMEFTNGLMVCIYLLYIFFFYLCIYM